VKCHLNSINKRGAARNVPFQKYSFIVHFSSFNLIRVVAFDTISKIDKNSTRNTQVMVEVSNLFN
jgi:hypothetical protein